MYFRKSRALSVDRLLRENGFCKPISESEELNPNDVPIRKVLYIKSVTNSSKNILVNVKLWRVGNSSMRVTVSQFSSDKHPQNKVFCGQSMRELEGYLRKLEAIA